MRGRVPPPPIDAVDAAVAGDSTLGGRWGERTRPRNARGAYSSLPTLKIGACHHSPAVDPAATCPEPDAIVRLGGRVIQRRFRGPVEANLPHGAGAAPMERPSPLRVEQVHQTSTRAGRTGEGGLEQACAAASPLRSGAVAHLARKHGAWRWNGASTRSVRHRSCWRARPAAARAEGHWRTRKPQGFHAGHSIVFTLNSAPRSNSSSSDTSRGDANVAFGGRLGIQRRCWGPVEANLPHVSNPHRWCGDSF